MAVLDPVKPTILSARLIPNVHPDFAAQIGLRPDQRSLALITCDIDDSLYVSLDEATKKADVEVVYAHSFYAGSAHASGPLSGEIIGILAGLSSSAIGRNPDAAGQIRGLAIILAAFAEGLGVLAVVVGLLSIFIK